MFPNEVMTMSIKTQNWIFQLHANNDPLQSFNPTIKLQTEEKHNLLYFVQLKATSKVIPWWFAIPT